MSPATSVFTAPDLAEPGSLEQAFELHRKALTEGNRLLNMAAEMRREADRAMDERAELKQEYRVRRGVDGLAGSAAEAVADTRVAGFKVMVDAKADASWLLKRACTYSTEAAAHFSKASAIASYVSTQALLNQLSRR